MTAAIIIGSLIAYGILCALTRNPVTALIALVLILGVFFAPAALLKWTGV